MFHKMVNPACPSAEVHWSSVPSRPIEARAVAHNTSASATLICRREWGSTSVERRLQPVSDMTGKRLEQTGGFLPIDE